MIGVTVSFVVAYSFSFHLFGLSSAQPGNGQSIPSVPDPPIPHLDSPPSSSVDEPRIICGGSQLSSPRFSPTTTDLIYPDDGCLEALSGLHASLLGPARSGRLLITSAATDHADTFNPAPVRTSQASGKCIASIEFVPVPETAGPQSMASADAIWSAGMEVLRECVTAQKMTEGLGRIGQSGTDGLRIRIVIEDDGDVEAEDEGNRWWFS